MVPSPPPLSFFLFFLFFTSTTTSYALKYPFAIKPVPPTPRPIQLTLVIHTGEYYASCSLYVTEYLIGINQIWDLQFRTKLDIRECTYESNIGGE